MFPKSWSWSVKTSHCLIKIYTDCIVKRGHCTKMSETENRLFFFNLVPALTKFGDISLQFRSSFSCIHLCENMRRVDITREEIVAGQIVYLSEHEIKALNWKTGLKRKSGKKSVDVHIKKSSVNKPCPFLSSVKLHCFSCLQCIPVTHHSWKNSICSKCIVWSYTAESNSTSTSQELDFPLLNLLRGF